MHLEPDKSGSFLDVKINIHFDLDIVVIVQEDFLQMVHI